MVGEREQLVGQACVLRTWGGPSLARKIAVEMAICEGEEQEEEDRLLGRWRSREDADFADGHL